MSSPVQLQNLNLTPDFLKSFLEFIRKVVRLLSCMSNQLNIRINGSGWTGETPAKKGEFFVVDKIGNVTH